MSEDTFYIVPEDTHNQLVEQAYAARGFDTDEQKCASRFSAHATRHGIRTHNALKALHLDDLFGSKKGGTIVEVSGANFIDSGNLKCKFGLVVLTESR